MSRRRLHPCLRRHAIPRSSRPGAQARDGHHRRRARPGLGLPASRPLRRLGAGLTGGGGGMLVQGFFAHPPDGRGPSFLEITLAVGVAIAGVALGFIIATLGNAARRRLARRRRARKRARRAELAEARARAQMSELCPHGWRAQITLYGDGAEPQADAPAGARGRVALDWSELEPDGLGVAVSRRVWAASITEALEAMVADRRTDETLERIEREVWRPEA